VLNGASEMMVVAFGDKGRHSRSCANPGIPNPKPDRAPLSTCTLGHVSIVTSAVAALSLPSTPDSKR
jgi:hypothetical protein